MIKTVRKEFTVLLIMSMLMQLLVGVTPVLAEDSSDLIAEPEFVPTMEVVLSPGETAGTTAATVTDHVYGSLIVNVTEEEIITPYVGDAAPTAGANLLADYESGTDITAGVAAGNYLQIYDVDMEEGARIAAFYQVKLIEDDIKEAEGVVEEDTEKSGIDEKPAEEPVEGQVEEPAEDSFEKIEEDMKGDIEKEKPVGDLMTLGMVPMSSGSIEGTYVLGEDVTGTLYSDGRLVIEGAGPMCQYNEFSSALYQNSSIKQVVIEEGITSISNYVFQSCTAIESITIPNSVTFIGMGAFKGCTSLDSVTIPNSVTYIGGYAFGNCSAMESVVIGEGVENIYSSAFVGCSALTTITNLFKGNQSQFNTPFSNAGPSSGTKIAYAYAANSKFISAAETAGYTIVYLDTYKVSFNSNGGTPVDDITGVSHGAIITAPAAAQTKPGYTFAGWYKESVLTNAWDFDTDMVTQDITLYAGWTAIDYQTDYEISGDPANYTLSGNVLTIGTGASGSSITIKGTMTEDTIAISDGVTNLTLILNGVSITSTSNPPIALQGTAAVTVELVDGTINTLDASGASGQAGLHVPQDASLTMTGTGSLTVTGGDIGYSGAGIGGSVSGDSGMITINSGTITATGMQGGAGIGGGWHGIAGPITINGGTVISTGTAAAGIGGGNCSKSTTITINGGTIYSTGTNGAAGIGGGWEASGGTINITGGTINAIGSTGSGIGSGADSATGSTITIDESAVVTAVSYRDTFAIDALSGSAGKVINAKLAAAISTSSDKFVKMDSRILTLPAWFDHFAFSTASASEISVYDDKGCNNQIGRIVTVSEGNTFIPVTDLSENPASVTQVRFQILLSNSKVAISGINGSYDYSGSPLTPEPTVKFGSVTLAKDTDYTLSYSNNNDVGTAKITITFIGKYYGTAEKTFTIILNQHMVTFKDYNGTTLKTETVNHGNGATAPTALTRTGYTFADWDMAFTNVTSDLTVTAIYTINQYTITFDCAGGSAVAPITQNYDSNITAPDKPTKTGYTFSDWTPALPAKMPAKSKIHTAQWTANSYTITYNLGGGTNSDANPATYNVATPTIILDIPTKNGYNFAGWWDTPTGGTQVAQITSGSTGDITLYAMWTPKINIDYKVEHYQQDVSWSGYTLKDTDNLSGTTAATVNASARTYTGFTENTLHGSRVASGTIAADGTLVLKLYYDRNTHTVSFNSNGDSELPDITGVRYGATIVAPAAPARTGYTFAGWHKEAGLTSTWDFGTDTVTADTDLYAKWTVNQYTITFDSNGGSEVTDQTLDYNSLADEPTALTRQGYTFAGWYKESELMNPWDFATDKIQAENITLYAKWICIGGGGSTSSSRGSTTPTQESVIVIVNGQEHNAGRETKTTEDEKSTVIIEVINQVIESKINEAVKNNPIGIGNVIQVPVADTESQMAKVELTGDIVKKLEENTFDVFVKRDNIEYIIPAEEFTISKVAENLGVSEKDLKDIKVEVRIAKIDETVVEKYNEVVRANEAELIFPPVEFEIAAKTIKADNTIKELEISKFSIYVEKAMEIPAGVDPSKITTGVVFNPDGTYSHVPTVIYQNDGKWYAKINSLTNSTYSAIWNPITVKSVENHWGRETVNDMASRLVIFNPETFDPNKAITRADFAEYIVRALGLYREGYKHENNFTDVSSTDARTLAILIANEYDIVSGYSDGTFRPAQQITREEAMAMLLPAMQITKLIGYDTYRYRNFTDFVKVSSWAEVAVKEALSAHVFNGTSAATISPKSNLTYAETAQAIKNLLVESKLIN